MLHYMLVMNKLLKIIIKSNAAPCLLKTNPFVFASLNTTSPSVRLSGDFLFKLYNFYAHIHCFYYRSTRFSL